MTTLREWVIRLWGTLRPTRRDAELEEELRLHLELAAEHERRRGDSTGRTERAAVIRSGGIAQSMETLRDQRGLPWLSDLGSDLRYGLRALRRSPLFASVAVLTLGLGVGANTAIFSVVQSVLLEPLPYPDADRLVLLTETRLGAPDYSGAISAQNYFDWTQQNTVFEQLAGVTGGEATLSGNGIEPVYVKGRRVSASYFDVLGLRPAFGRTFAPDEGQPHAAHVVVLSHRLWTSHFGSDPAAIGTAVRLDGEVYTVIGVMPAGTTVDLLDPELWRPRDLGRQGGALTADGQTSRGLRDLNRAIAKLKPGVTLDQARTEMDAIAGRLAEAYPESNRGWGVLVQPLPRAVDPAFEASLYLLFAAVGVVLLLCCVNLAHLVLARGATRTREVAIRVALGARRGRLVRQFLTENTAIAAGGGLVGIAIAYIVLAMMKMAIPVAGPRAAVPAETTITIDAPLWFFALALSLLTTVVFGLGPAVAATQPALLRTMRGAGAPGVTTHRAHGRLRSTLVVGELALAFVLLTSAGLLIQSFFALRQQVEEGFDSANVLTAQLPIPETRFKDPATLNSYLDQIADRIQAVAGVRDVAFTDGLPSQGFPFGRSFQIAGQPPVERAQRPTSGFKTVSPSYFRAVGLRMLEGRALSDRDGRGTPLVVVINETMARTHFRGTNPIAQRVLMAPGGLYGPRDRPEAAWEVVGIVADEGMWPFGDRAPHSTMYVTLEQNPTCCLALVVRAALDPTRLQEPIRQAVAAFDARQALSSIQPLDHIKNEPIASDRLRSMLLGVFATIALALAIMGLYGVMAHAVNQRTHEIAIRAALGANRGNLLGLVGHQAIVIIVLGLGIGLSTSLVVTRVLESVLYGVGPSDPRTMAAVAGLLTAIALIACYVPARRVTRIDPLVAIRAE